MEEKLLILGGGDGIKTVVCFVGLFVFFLFYCLQIMQATNTPVSGVGLYLDRILFLEIYDCLGF